MLLREKKFGMNLNVKFYEFVQHAILFLSDYYILPERQTNFHIATFCLEPQRAANPLPLDQIPFSKNKKRAYKFYYLVFHAAFKLILASSGNHWDARKQDYLVFGNLFNPSNLFSILVHDKYAGYFLPFHLLMASIDNCHCPTQPQQ